jgi:hypothetical protein
MISTTRLSSVTTALAGIRRLRANVPTKGTWTPTLTGITTPGSNTYTTQIGEYVTDGVRCTASFRIVVNAIAGGPAGAVCVSLPLLANAGSPPYVGSIGRCSGVTLSASSEGLYVESVAGGSYATLRQGYAASELDIPWANIASGAEIRGTITYAL